MAAYLIGGDVYLLRFADSNFIRATRTEAEEGAIQISPDGRMISYVRNNDLYVHDIRSSREKRLTSDGSETTLNGTLSWVYWEEIFGRRDTGYWWSPDSGSIAYLRTDDSQVSVMRFVDYLMLPSSYSRRLAAVLRDLAVG